MALEDLNPAVRVEEILDGADIEPATRLEYFMKKAANEVPKPAGSSDAGKVVTVNEDGDGYELAEPGTGLPEIAGVSDAGKVVAVNAAGSAYELGALTYGKLVALPAGILSLLQTALQAAITYAVTNSSTGIVAKETLAYTGTGWEQLMSDIREAADFISAGKNAYLSGLTDVPFAIQHAYKTGNGGGGFNFVLPYFYYGSPLNKIMTISGHMASVLDDGVLTGVQGAVAVQIWTMAS